MTTRRLILCLIVSAGALFLVARAATSIFPLRVHAQELSSAPIQVVQGGENLVHRAPLVYPRRAIERQVEGDVVLELSVDEQGQVSDARVLSGPEELRRACLQSVLEWRYKTSKSASAGTQVMIHFQLPSEGTSSEIVLPPALAESEDASVRYFVMSDPQGATDAERQMKLLEERMQSTGATAEEKANYKKQLAQLKAQIVEEAENPLAQVVGDSQDLEREADEIKAKIADPGTPPEDRAKLKKKFAELEAEMGRVSEGPIALQLSDQDASDLRYVVTGGQIGVDGKLTQIGSERVPQATLDALIPRLGVHVGDMINDDVAERVRETVRQTLGEQYRALFNPNVGGGLVLVIVGPEQP